MESNIKTFEDACTALAIDATLPVFPALPENQQKALAAHYQLVIVAQALNEGWQPNWNDEDECKYYPWFDMDGSGSSGFGFSRFGYVYGRTSTYLGSRLVYKTSELAKYAGTQFKDLYQKYFVISQ